MATRPFPVVQVAEFPVTSRARVTLWVAKYGVSRLSRSLKTDRRTVHTWTQRIRPTQPSLATVRNMIALSMLEPLTDGPLRYEDFFGEVAIAGHTMHHYGRSSATSPRQILTRRVI